MDKIALIKNLELVSNCLDDLDLFKEADDLEGIMVKVATMGGLHYDKESYDDIGAQYKMLDKSRQRYFANPEGWEDLSEKIEDLFDNKYKVVLDGDLKDAYKDYGELDTHGMHNAIKVNGKEGGWRYLKDTAEYDVAKDLKDNMVKELGIDSEADWLIRDARKIIDSEVKDRINQMGWLKALYDDWYGSKFAE